ncbi:MAG: response regulator, partial [Clostridiales bacterium]|nr:response regulator [Clostridiales bacterium]
VDVVSNGKEAVGSFETRQYDVVLMDIQMPVMNGLEAAVEIRKLEKSGRHIPIIALTAYTLKGDRERFLMMGMDGYISKPINMEELFYTVEQMASNNRGNPSILPSDIKIMEDGKLVFSNTEKLVLKGNTESIVLEIGENIEKLKVAVQIDKLQLVEELSHHIKNQSIEIEYMEMKDVAFEVELAARRGKLEEVEQKIEKMSMEYEILQHRISALKEEQ